MITGFSMTLALATLPAETQAAPRRHMSFPGRNWEQADPSTLGVDAAKLDAAVSYLKAHAGRNGVDELVIVRDGRIIWQGRSTDTMHGVWSVTKAFTSTVLGLLIDDKKVTLDSLAQDYVPSLATAYPTVTLGHFNTMTSGYRAVGDEPQGSYLHGPSRTPFVPSPSPLFTPPGSKYAYWDSAMNQFANVLTRITGEPIEALFKRRIADPIGMDPSRWDWGDLGKIDGIVVNGGAGNLGKHVQITARQLARLGHLFLNRGQWKGKQLISRAWVDQAVRAHVPATMPLGHPASGIDGRGTYGQNWWANGILANGHRKWPGAPLGTFARSGYNNNDLFVIPEWRMVIVRLGLDQRDRELTDAVYSTFLRRVGQALVDPSGPPSARQD